MKNNLSSINARVYRDIETATPQAAAVKPLPAELPDEATQASHTPVPWLVQVPCSSELTCRNIRGPSDEHVAKVGWRDYSEGQETDLANADLIVRAVNSHAQLVAALNDIVEWLLPDLKEDIKSFGDDKALAQIAIYEDRARAALAAAKDSL